MSSPSTCPSCGARVSTDAARCDLCGTVLEDRSEPVQSSAESESKESDDEAPPPAADDAGSGEDRPSVYCNQCGWQNPGGAKFCSRCGHELQDLSAADAPAGTRYVSADLPTASRADSSEETDPPSTDPSNSGPDEGRGIGREIGLVVGTAVVVVFGFFFVTQWSRHSQWTDGEGPEASAPSQEQQSDASVPGGRQRGGAGSIEGGDGAGTSLASLEGLVETTGEDLSDRVAGQVDSLRGRAEAAEGGEKRTLLRRRANLLLGAGAPGRAALVQQDVAETSGAVEDQRRTADLLYRWMRKVQGEGQRDQVLDIARHVAQAYESVVEQRPDDLDARTRMGEAYLLTNNPMRGIEEINAVLDEDSTFVPARFQKGLALLQINRLDRSLEQFEAVQRHSDPDSSFHQQAQQAIDVINEQMERKTGQSPSTRP